MWRNSLIKYFIFCGSRLLNFYLPIEAKKIKIKICWYWQMLSRHKQLFLAYGIDFLFSFSFVLIITHSPVMSLMFLRIYVYFNIFYSAFLGFSGRIIQIATHHYQKLEPGLSQPSHFIDKKTFNFLPFRIFFNW